eukprot:1848110-Ditylum_brightwellii.AAC.1
MGPGIPLTITLTSLKSSALIRNLVDVVPHWLALVVECGRKASTLDVTAAAKTKIGMKYFIVVMIFG